MPRFSSHPTNPNTIVKNDNNIILPKGVNIFTPPWLFRRRHKTDQSQIFYCQDEIQKQNPGTYCDKKYLLQSSCVTCLKFLLSLYNLFCLTFYLPFVVVVAKAYHRGLTLTPLKLGQGAPRPADRYEDVINPQVLGLLVSDPCARLAPWQKWFQ